LNQLTNQVARRLLATLACLVAFTSSAPAQTLSAQAPTAQAPTTDLPNWIKDVGARRAPKAKRTCLVDAVGDGATKATRAIQQAIDKCAKSSGGTVIFKAGTYVTGALFLKSNVHLLVETGVTLTGSQDDADYPSLWTRVAGIEMKWPAALINVNGQRNVKISGGGTIDGNGKKWWDKYWALRREYEPRGLRWASDYDAERVRLLVISKSSDVTIENLSLKRSGFWTVQVVYSDHVTVDRIKITDNSGPSTDGVDIDSSSYVLVQNCDIDNNDDDICLKAGRDYDGLRVNRPTEYVVIRDNITRRGGGIISFGSETSGGIRKVVAYNNRGIGTNEGIRFKSAKTRGGYVEDVLIRDLKMENVRVPFSFTLNWNPSYSYATIPKDARDIPAHWIALSTKVEPPERGYCEFRNIRIENVEIVNAWLIFSATGLPEKPIVDVSFANVTAQGTNAGSIEYARDWTMRNVRLKAKEPLKITNSQNVESPEMTAAVWPVWPEGKMPGLGARDPEQDRPPQGDNVQRITNVSRPTLTLFPVPKKGAPAPAIIVCPGGAYNYVVHDKEGTEIAAWLNSAGIGALVLKYRVPENREGALQDLQRALSLARAHAGEWNIDPQRLGVMGFSAGGNLAAKASTLFDQRSYTPLDAVDGQSCRPDFAVLVYPAYLESEGKLATDLNLRAKIPPTLIVSTEDDDRFVLGSKLYHRALDELKLANEFLLYPDGGHGYGLRSDKAVRVWPQAALTWLHKNGIR
jgi:acetyl esterase/lipase